MKTGYIIILLIALSLAMILSAGGIIPEFIYGSQYAILIWVAIMILLALGFYRLISR